MHLLTINAIAGFGHGGGTLGGPDEKPPTHHGDLETIGESAIDAHRRNGEEKGVRKRGNMGGGEQEMRSNSMRLECRS